MHSMSSVYTKPLGGCSVTSLYRSVWRTDSALRQYMYFLVMSQHTIHYDMNINELRQCCFDGGASLTGFVVQPVSLISMASAVQQ